MPPLPHLLDHEAQDPAMKHLEALSALRRHPLCSIAAAGVLALAGAGAWAADPAGAPAAAAPAKAATAPQRLFYAAPEAAVNALLDAMRKDDVGALKRILGPGSANIVESGDDAADREGRQKFIAAFDRHHTLEKTGDAKATLVIGDEAWPMPAPLVRRTQGWTFDARAGAQEIVARRIGRNELDAIQVCLAFVDMQREYAEVDRDGDDLLEYTSRLISTRGRRDGLYWEAPPGEPPSPAGPRLAQASPDTLASRDAAAPYHGYYFRVLTQGGRHAPGGARDWRVNGQLIGGIALVAWPARYRVSGVKTFKCSLEGVVYERDFGGSTAVEVAKIQAYDPGPGWAKVK
jgi:hypothetical protein